MAAVGMAASAQLEARRVSSAGASSSSTKVPAQHQPRSCGGSPVRFSGRRQQPVGRALRAHRRLQRLCCTAFGSTDRFGSPDFMAPQGAGEAWDVLGLGQVRLVLPTLVCRPFACSWLVLQRGCRRLEGNALGLPNAAGHGGLFSLRGRRLPRTVASRERVTQVGRIAGGLLLKCCCRNQPIPAAEAACV